jgi:ADP-heptose:LPS heptosyltransferase
MIKILVVSIQGIGNTTLLLPVIRQMAIQNKCELDIVISNNGSHEILQGNPYIGRVYIWDERKASLQNLLILREQLRQTMYDVAYAAYPNWSRENAIIFLSRAKKKIGYKCGAIDLIGRFFSILNGFKIGRQNNQHDLINNLKLLELNKNDIDLMPSYFFFSSDENKHGEFLLTEVSVNGHKPIIGIHPGSKQYKRWDVDNFANVARGIKQKYPSAWFLIFGGNEEKDVMRNLWNRINDCAVMMKVITIRQVAWLVKYCDLFIGNDSMLLHVAALQGVPAVGIFGSTDYRRIGPIGSKSIVIRKNCICSPCYERGLNFYERCKYGLKCIKDVSQFDVFEIADQYLKLILNSGECVDNTRIYCGQNYKTEFLETNTLVCHVKCE